VVLQAAAEAPHTTVADGGAACQMLQRRFFGIWMLASTGQHFKRDEKREDANAQSACLFFL